MSDIRDDLKAVMESLHEPYQQPDPPSMVLTWPQWTAMYKTAELQRHRIEDMEDEIARLRALLGECVPWLHDYEVLRAWDDVDDVIGRVVKEATR